jgi:hypothetical protein
MNINFYQTSLDGAIQWTKEQIEPLKDRDVDESPI